MKPQDPGNRAIGEGWIYVSVGITFALSVAAFALGGVWLDRRFGTMPLLTILGTLFGMALTGFWLYNRLRGGRGRGPSAR